jgi:hypothetical protein
MMTNNHEESDLKDLGKAFAILVFIIVGAPVLWSMSLPDYADNCKVSLLPCVGVNE